MPVAASMPASAEAAIGARDPSAAKQLPALTLEQQAVLARDKAAEHGHGS
jgi:hypothetical protein